MFIEDYKVTLLNTTTLAENCRAELFWKKILNKHSKIKAAFLGTWTQKQKRKIIIKLKP